MPKMIVSIDGVVIKEVQLTKDRTTLGRRPYNDIVIDNLAISGEHAVLEMQGGQVNLEDLDSTNGTYVNGKAARKQLLQHGDIIDVGKYKIKFDDQSEAVAARSQAHPSTATVPSVALIASLKVLSGAASGREVPLSKVVTTLGKPGVAVAAITRRHGGFFVHHVEGAGNPTLNGETFGIDPTGLKNGDVIELAGTKMQFIQA
jgi:pSer/pThr/pTyr-binding forkhead associated (FHA) protein